MGTQKKNMQSKGMEDSTLKELKIMEVTKPLDIKFKIMVMQMIKKVTDNYKELSEDYINMRKKIETMNKTRKK